MTRKLLRQLLAMATGIGLTAAMFFGLGVWRHSQDEAWCRHAAAGGVVSGDDPRESDLVDRIRGACAVQRQRQRVMFGSVWRSGGQEASRCGFELARLQLVSDEDPEALGSALRQYGLSDSQFEISDRADQDRFVQACLSSGHQSR